MTPLGVITSRSARSPLGVGSLCVCSDAWILFGAVWKTLTWTWLKMHWSLCDAWPMYGRVMVDLNCGRSSGGRLGLGWLKLKCLYLLSCSDVLMWWSSCFKLCWSQVLKARQTNVLWTADLMRGWWNEEGFPTYNTARHLTKIIHPLVGYTRQGWCLPHSLRMR